MDSGTGSWKGGDETDYEACLASCCVPNPARLTCLIHSRVSPSSLLPCLSPLGEEGREGIMPILQMRD